MNILGAQQQPLVETVVTRLYDDGPEPVRFTWWIEEYKRTFKVWGHTDDDGDRDVDGLPEHDSLMEAWKEMNDIIAEGEPLGIEYTDSYRELEKFIENVAEPFGL